MRLRACRVEANPQILSTAAEAGNVRAIGLLAHSAAHPKESQHPATGSTALHEAAAAGQVEAVRELIRQGADVNARDLKGQSSLQTACRRSLELRGGPLCVCRSGAATRRGDARPGRGLQIAHQNGGQTGRARQPEDDP